MSKIALANDNRSPLQEEAAALAVQFGPNAYSDYLSKHGALPDPATASTIGKLIGGRVKASDGKLHPPLTAADKTYRRDVRRRRREWHRKLDALAPASSALMLLLDQNPESPETVAA